MLLSFRSNAPGLEDTAFLIERAALSTCGDLESGFLVHAGPVERHPGTGAGQAAARLAALPGVGLVVLIRNPGLVLDEGLTDRIAAARARLTPLDGRWSLAAAAGLTPRGERVSALYSSASPHLPLNPTPRPLIDALPDLCLIDAAWLRRLAASGSPLPDSALETAVIAEGYLHDRVALYLPELVAGVDGALRARNPLKYRRELEDRLADILPGEEIATLSGRLTIEPAAAPPDAETPSNEQRPGAAGALSAAVERVVVGFCDPLSLSIVTRTRFTRPHLLERLLASITRARRADTRIEVVLSSDAPRETCEAALAGLRPAFPQLTLRLCHNPAEGHSRVTNLVAGLRAASGAYVALMDDDDYVDLFAFEEMQRTLFLGARPLMVTGSAVHDEEWTETPSGRHVLGQQSMRASYPASGWRRMFGGVNRLPVCALVMPRERLLARLDAFAFRHDLSEDYALGLLVLTDPELPEVAELPGTFGHISMRRSETQSMMLADRRPWVRDIALYLADLARTPAAAGPGKWALLADHHSSDAAIGAKSVAELEAALAERERQIRLMRREIDCLRAAEALPPAAGATGGAQTREPPREAA